MGSVLFELPMHRAAFHRALVGVLALGCDSAPNDLREWTAADHHHQAEPGTQGVVPSLPSPPSATVEGEQPNDVTAVSFLRHCARCHGPNGRGDGPDGAMVGARRLDDAGWQGEASDDRIAGVVRAGKGKMPGFDFPAATVEALVRHVRGFSPEGTPAGAAPSAQPPAPSVRRMATAPGLPVASSSPTPTRSQTANGSRAADGASAGAPYAGAGGNPSTMGRNP